MYPSRHFIYSILFCLILVPFLKFWTFVVFFAAFFIDFDHYLYYLIKFKNPSVKKAYNYHLPILPDEKIHIFHTIEFYLLLIALSFLHIFFIFILLGVSFHFILDIIDVNMYRWKVGRRTKSIYTWINRH